MNFENKLISGLLIKRYKRFFADIKINNKIVTAHCPNTGSMYGLLKKGNKVWISKSNNPYRKLKYTLEIIEDNNSKVGVNTHSANKIIYHALQNKLINEFKDFVEIKTEIMVRKQDLIFLLLIKKIKLLLKLKTLLFLEKKTS